MFFFGATNEVVDCQWKLLIILYQAPALSKSRSRRTSYDHNYLSSASTLQALPKHPVSTIDGLVLAQCWLVPLEQCHRIQFDNFETANPQMLQI
jgi:hypothetical protein